MTKLLAPLVLLVLAGIAQAQSGATFLKKTPAEWARQLTAGTDANQRRSAAFALGALGSHAAPAVEAMKASLAGADG